MIAKSESQNRHEMLIEFLSKYLTYKDGNPRLPKIDKQISTDGFKKIDTNAIIAATVLFVEALNLGGGSIGKIDLYSLLQAYLTVPEYTEKINICVSEALSVKNNNRP